MCTKENIEKALAIFQSLVEEHDGTYDVEKAEQMLLALHPELKDRVQRIYDVHNAVSAMRRGQME